MTRVWIGICAALMLLAGTPVAAETAREAYTRLLSEMRQDQRVKFRDDPTDVTGKSWEFAKSVMGLWGVNPNWADGADFARTVAAEGANFDNTFPVAIKALATNYAPEAFQKRLEKMDGTKLLQMAEALGVNVTEDLAASTKSLQRLVLEHMTETVSKVAAEGSDSGADNAAVMAFVEVLNKACPPCDTTYKGVELAREAALYTRNAFENAKTQTMFEIIERNDYNKQEFLTIYKKNTSYYNEARRALAAYHRSQGKAPPSEKQVEEYIYARYERWRKEKKERQAEADILEKAFVHFDKLQYYELEKMFGPGSVASHTEKYQAAYLDLYRRMIALRGDAHWPPGGDDGRKTVRDEVARLLKLWKTGKIGVAELRYEMRKLAASWGWIPKGRVGPPPAKPVPPAPPSEEEVKARQSLVIERLSRLNHRKLSATMEALGMEMPVGVLQCLCASQGIMGAGLSYHPEPGGDCDNSDPCKGGNWGCVSHDLPSDPAIWKSCIALKPIKLPGKDGEEPTEMTLDALIEQKLRERK